MYLRSYVAIVTNTAKSSVLSGGKLACTFGLQYRPCVPFILEPAGSSKGLSFVWLVVST